jgi:cholesterol transport system auxiliary component
MEPSVPQALRARRIPVYTGPQTIQYLKAAEWVENPSDLFRQLLSETISGTTGRVVLDPAQYTHDPGIRLTGQLLMFGLDETRMEVVVAYEAVLARGNAAVTTNRFEARQPVAGVTPAIVAPALNEAANRVAAQVTAWIGR